jgi:hypothetical protein
MAKKKLTAVFVEKVQLPLGADRIDYHDTVLSGFGLRVGRKKRAYFVMVRSLRNGKWTMTRATLGTTAELSLVQARESAREAIERAQQG